MELPLPLPAPSGPQHRRASASAASDAFINSRTHRRRRNAPFFFTFTPTYADLALIAYLQMRSEVGSSDVKQSTVHSIHLMLFAHCTTPEMYPAEFLMMYPEMYP